ncbi:hypothetical protein [Streptomyces sp. NRRL B-24484]|uniref:hypothetical protein n=1 Tax=Streptomyces sp. NRRL B-24484 TaxID=1463833 RepID=UPI001F441F3F|nr:hypothetical protein [Streptomyces sp. NRRL B-24484]
MEVSVDTEGLDALVRALRAEEDGKELRKELARNMRDALKPAVADAKAAVMAVTANSTASPALRAGVARKIRPEVKLGGKWSGARVKAKKTPNIRGFANAAKRLQQAAGWRTQSWGRGWRVQHGKVDWFDRAMQPVAPQARRAVLDAMESMARRIRSRAG